MIVDYNKQNMYEDDYFNPVEPNDYDDVNDIRLNDPHRKDVGVNYLTRKIQLDNHKTKNIRVKVFTSSGPGSYIRDAESGSYYPNKVGSKDEDLFYKVMVSTGECKSANGSNTLFYCSPQHYQNHLLDYSFQEVDNDSVLKWESKRDARLKELKKKKGF